MKKVLILLATILSSLSIHAQEIVQEMAIDSVSLNDSTISELNKEAFLLVDNMQHATIHQDSLIRQLMIDKQLGTQRGQTLVNGFRVQVYSSNQQQIAKNEALMLQQQLESLLQQPVYALSEPPFWKVRIGNFLTRDEATAYIAEIINQRPDLQSSTYIVPDKVIIIN